MDEVETVRLGKRTRPGRRAGRTPAAAIPGEKQHAIDVEGAATPGRGVGPLEGRQRGVAGQYQRVGSERAFSVPAFPYGMALDYISRRRKFAHTN
jgi:hypothetical protein